MASHGPPCRTIELEREWGESAELVNRHSRPFVFNSATAVGLVKITKWAIYMDLVSPFPGPLARSTSRPTVAINYQCIGCWMMVCINKMRNSKMMMSHRCRIISQIALLSRPSTVSSSHPVSSRSGTRSVVSLSFRLFIVFRNPVIVAATRLRYFWNWFLGFASGWDFLL